MALTLASMGHPVAAVDQRGHGASARRAAGGPYDWATLTGDLVVVCRALGWLAGPDRRPVVAGQSWGASVVLELAARHPETLRSVVLVDGGMNDMADGFADWPSCEAVLMPPVLAGTSREALEGRLRTEHPDWSDEGIAATLANLEVMPDGTVSAWLPREDHRAILRQMWEDRPSLVYPGVTVPVLLLPAQGGASPSRWLAMKREGVARATALLPQCEVHWVTGDHDLHVQHPELLAGLVHQFAGGSAPG
jgi:pimeloyl-ACP methyl ester carboxylesterase